MRREIYCAIRYRLSAISQADSRQTGSKPYRHPQSHQRLLNRDLDAPHLAVNALEAVVRRTAEAPVRRAHRCEQTELEGEPRRAFAGEFRTGQVVAAQADRRPRADDLGVADAEARRPHLLGGELGRDRAAQHADLGGQRARDVDTEPRVDLRGLEVLEARLLVMRIE